MSAADGILWLVTIGPCGSETGRVALADAPARDQLPLRRFAEEGLKADAVAVIVVRPAADATCQPCAQELGAIRRAQRTLGQIGLRLHDYLLWHGERSVSLRREGRL